MAAKLSSLGGVTINNKNDNILKLNLLMLTALSKLFIFLENLLLLIVINVALKCILKVFIKGM